MQADAKCILSCLELIMIFCGPDTEVCEAMVAPVDTSHSSSGFDEGNTQTPSPDAYHILLQDRGRHMHLLESSATQLAPNVTSSFPNIYADILQLRDIGRVSLNAIALVRLPTTHASTGLRRFNSRGPFGPNVYNKRRPSIDRCGTISKRTIDELYRIAAFQLYGAFWAERLLWTQNLDG